MQRFVHCLLKTILEIWNSILEVMQLSTKQGETSLVYSTGRDMAGTSVTEPSVPGHQMLRSTVGSIQSYGSIQLGSESVGTTVLELFVDVYMIILINYSDLIS